MSRGRLVSVGSLKVRLVIFALLFISMVILATALHYNYKRSKETLEKKKAEKARLEHLIEEEKQRTVEIADYRAYIETKSYIEEIAREVLGLVYPDEIIFKPVDDLPPRGDELSPSPGASK